MNDVAYAVTLCMATLGPTKTIPAFYLATRSADARTRLALAAKSTLVATAIVLFVALVASGTLLTWRVSLEAVEIAGGLVLVLAAVKTLTELGFAADAQAQAADSEGAIAGTGLFGRPVLTPLAVPAIVPPVGIMVVLFFAGTSLGDSRQQTQAVYVDGEPLVDLWGGHLDAARTQPWRRETIVNTFSTTKTMTALAMLVLADRGVLDLDAPIAKYWPEFAQNGKAGVLVRHVLGHTSGLPGWSEPMTLADILDRDEGTAALARQAEWWPSGTKIGYHAITFGPLLGEIVRRITGKTLGRFFAEEIAGPLGADFHIGTGPECDDRVAPLIQSSPPIVPTPGDDVRNQVFFNPLVLAPHAFTLAWRRGELGGSNGYGNARSVGAVQSVLACGGEARGVRLLSKTGCERALEQQAEGADIVAGFPLRWGMGYGIYNKTMDTIYGGRLSGRRVAFWGGSGGSIVVNDLDSRMTVSYVMNKHVEHGGIDQRGVDIIVATFDSLAGRELGPKPQWAGLPPAAA